MKLETLFSFIETYINRRRVKRFVNKLDKLPGWIEKSNLPAHNRVKLEKTFKLIMLQLFKPRTENVRKKLNKLKK